ncbi:MAG TPA: hypothetical protein VGP02_05770, partial [Mycobacteriales bacterium]|nr:hypothetical protein [Mycobacteriales bacterium]
MPQRGDVVDRGAELLEGCRHRVPRGGKPVRRELPAYARHQVEHGVVAPVAGAVRLPGQDGTVDPEPLGDRR